MKKFLIFIVLLIIVCVVGAQFVVPKYMESIVEDELNQSLKPSSQTVVIESTPAFKLVYGQADHAAGTLENVQLGKLNFLVFIMRQIILLLILFLSLHLMRLRS